MTLNIICRIASTTQNIYMTLNSTKKRYIDNIFYVKKCQKKVF